MKRPWRSERDFNREIDAHIALETDRLIADGMDPADAHAAARRAFGNITHTRERFHESSVAASWLDTVRQDVWYTFRSFRRQPWLAAAVVLAIALAVAANAALFSVFDGVLFRPLPFHEPDRIVFRENLTRPPYLRLEMLNELMATPLLSDAALAFANETMFQQDTEAASDLQMRGARVSPNFFSFLGVQPFLGRVFTEEDFDARGFCQCVMVGFDLWRTQFGADPTVVGTYIDLPGQRTVGRVRPLLIGVLPPGFDFPQGTKVWGLAQFYNASQPVNSNAPNYLRLAPGASIDDLRTLFPRVTFTPLREHVRPRGAEALAVLLAGSGLLMLVAWVQVASLLFSRSASRAAELGIRLALGAGRWRLARQFATEGTVIAALALAIGWSLAPGLVRLIVWVLPPELTLSQVVSPDRRVFMFAIVLSALGVVIIALAPFDVLRRTSPLGLLRGSIFGAADVSAARTRAVLIVGQLAVTATVLYMAGLAVRSFQHATEADLGFTPDRTLAFRLPFTTVPTATTPDELRAYFAGQGARFGQVLPALRAMPGVAAAGGGRVPLVPSLFGGEQLQDLRPSLDRENTTIEARVTCITSGYIEALGIQVREGRAPDSSGAIVNRTMARHLEPYGPVLGQSVSFQSGTFEIVGIYDDLVMSRPDVAVPPEIILSWSDQFFSSVIPTVVVRVRHRNDEASVIAGIQQMLTTIFPAEPARRVLRLENEARDATRDHRARSTVLGLIALLCLPLASAGIASALLHAVRQQARDIGIRLALGADAGTIRRRVLGHALLCVTVGLALGVAGGLAIGRWMSAYLYGVHAVDAWSIAGVVIVLMTVAVVSAWWPAYRASTIDPSVVLREA